MTVQTNTIQGPPFRCPECSAEFDKRGGLGSHRFSIHGVSGTSTGSRAYKEGKLTHKRPYTKRTPIIHATKRTYNKKAKSNPLLDMFANPNQTIQEIDFAIADKQVIIDNLRKQVRGLLDNVEVLERVKTMLQEPKQAFEQAVA